MLAVAAAVVWLLLALDRPTSTFHFAPLIVAAAWPVVTRIDTETRLSTRDAALRAGAGLVLGVAVGIVLAATDSLDGPSLWDDDSAELETFIFTVAGAGFGALYAVRR